MSAASHTRCTYRRLATTLDEADIGPEPPAGGCNGHSSELDVNRGCFQKSQDLLAKMLSEEEHGDGKELVTTEK